MSVPCIPIQLLKAGGFLMEKEQLEAVKCIPITLILPEGASGPIWELFRTVASLIILQDMGGAFLMIAESYSTA